MSPEKLGSVDSLQVEVEEDQAGRSGAGAVFAGVLLRVNVGAFPAERWTDFAIVILASLADLSVRLLRGDATGGVVRFMEGPYVVEVAATSSDGWRVALIEDRAQRIVRHDGLFEREPFLQSLLAAGDRMLAVCQEQGWRSSDS